MKKNKLSTLLFFLIFSLFTALYANNNLKFVFRGRAAGNEASIKVKLQGEYEKIPNASFKMKVLIFSDSTLIREAKDINLSRDQNNVFKMNLDLNGLDLTKKYSLFIKPDKYLGKLFCSSSSYSKNCTQSGIVFTTGTNNLDLVFEQLFSGDIAPQDGKVTAQDISKIMNDIGDSGSNGLSTDINSDGKVETVDYSLALYSLSKNYEDDIYPQVSATPTPTGYQSQTPTPTPTSLTSPSPTVSPSPTTTAGGSGTCKATINGKIYVKAMGQTYCSPMTNEKAEVCVSSASECTQVKCVDRVIEESKSAVNVCASGFGNLDEAASRATLSCQVEFVVGPCTPTPTPSINCSQEGPSC